MHRLTILLPAILLAGGCSGAPSSDPLEGYVREVLDGDSLVIEIDEVRETVSLLGIDSPETDQCLGDEAARVATSDLALSQPVEFAFAGKDSDGNRLAIVTQDGAALATNLVAAGMAVPIAAEGPAMPKLADAQREARDHRAGLYSHDEACTLPAQVQAVEQAIDDALDHPEPTNADDVVRPIQSLVPAIVAAKALEEAMLAGRLGLTARAFTTEDLARISVRLTAKIASAHSEVVRLRTLRDTLRIEERREREREQARIAQEQEQQRIRRANAASSSSSSHPSSSSDSDSSSGSSYSGYTGPRCYAPGGKTWTPC
jgi:micrococcal nuclease